jgi:hypothetical protein
MRIECHMQDFCMLLRLASSSICRYTADVSPATDLEAVMKIIPSLSTALVLSWIFSFPLPAEDWKTADGRAYPDVTVIKSEPDAVTILYRDGGALVPLAQLSPDLQRRFNYNPDRAAKAAAARAQADAKSAAALQKEVVLAKKLKAADAAAEKTKPIKPKPAPTAVAQADPTHLSRDDLRRDDRADSHHFDESYPARNDDHRNTTRDVHSLNP